MNLYLKNLQINNITTVLFDKDGTFLDDNIYWGKLAECRIKKIISHFKLDQDAFSALCYSIGYEPILCKLIKNGVVGTLSRNEVIDFTVLELKKYNITTDFSEISELFNKVHEEFTNDMSKYIKFINYSENFIKELKNHNIKLGVVTSDTYNHTKETLKILNIEDCFSCVIGKDNCKKDKKTGEPALIALKELNALPAETLVIGDALMDYEMAKNAGIENCILVGTGQTEIEDLKKYTKYVVNNLSEIRIE